MCDHGDLDEHPTHELRADRGSNRPRLGEVGCVDPVEATEVVEVGEMHEARDDVRKRAAVLLEQRGNVADGLLRLLLDRIARQLAVRGEAALAREKDEAVGGACR
jgi:hypothetical protein